MGLFCQKIVSFAGVNLNFMKVSTENDNNFGYTKVTILVDNIPLMTSIIGRFCHYRKYAFIDGYSKVKAIRNPRVLS